ncbi:DUF1835 domain-containing protein [Fulvivirga ligni]|uniref:DUF1835 domain-containing protein n=1 Tax=Fulvivirga ligni TaxID=2904246 RepID=UPI001F459F1C|nr:DUF1835 domain-containing protein [Fulvivirga ligni]UII19933.1 DUF1835 domain-containing protein [Fulvivirga ligni]
MKPQYHILNGDALKEQFPASLDGEIIVARECLVEGDVQGANLEEVMTTRANFLHSVYGEPLESYQQNTAEEFRKIKGLDLQSEINLWFEDDLFCQVNFWFVAHILVSAGHQEHIFLIKPETHTPYGFASYSPGELINLYASRIQLKELNKIACLWNAYQANDSDRLLSTAHELAVDYPFILPAVKAHLDRLPSNNQPGRPVATLKQIMNELHTKEFGPVFQEFSKRESIYGFGDLQVKRLYDQILSE